MNVLGRHVRTVDAWRLVQRGGVRALAVRAVRVGYRRLGAGSLDFPLLPGDIADSARLRLAVPPNRPRRGEPLTVGWLTVPPSLGSGGHTTMFRMIEALEAAGHTCVVYLYDRFDGRLGDRTSVIRQGWPSVRAEIRDIADGVAHLDAWVATGWASAHVLGSRITMPTRRFYFVQDYEPWFYAHGSEFALAEDTYRFGFRCITVGQMVADVLSERFGIDAAVAHFGVDTDVYRMTNRGSRTGVVFYAKPDVARRGYVLGALALGEFHRRHPEQPIHMFGEPPDEFVNFPVVAHGKVSPGELNELYNQTIAGLAMSFTNVSLIPDEMLASGNVPVVNESPYPRASLSNAHVVWARPTPAALSDALCAVVESDDVAGRASRAAADVPADAWRPAQAAVVSAIEDEVYG